MNSDITILETKIHQVIDSLPPGIALVAATKTRTVAEVQAAVHAGIKMIGYNYVQETEQMQNIIGREVQWHLIGHLQRNKIKKAIKLFDMIQTLDSVQLAEELESECVKAQIKMPVLIEVNSGREVNKTGIFPEQVEVLIEKIRLLPHLHIQGIMTMGPFWDNPAELRPFFKETRLIFERLAGSNQPGVEMRFLSMGMSDSYKIAIEEGANMVRLGTILFGPRR
jgi:PLP dependent protein